MHVVVEECIHTSTHMFCMLCMYNPYQLGLARPYYRGILADFPDFIPVSMYVCASLFVFGSISE